MIDSFVRDAIVEACTADGGDELGELAEAWLLMPYVAGETLGARMRRLARDTGRPELRVRRQVAQVRAIARTVTLDFFVRGERAGELAG